MGWLRDETGLERCAANHVPLTPLSHLNRTAAIFGRRTALVYGPHRWTYGAYHADVSRLAGGLGALGVKPGDVVATLIPNLPAQAMAHFAVPATGAVLNTINTRLEPETVAYILSHGEARVVLCDTQFLPLLESAIALCDHSPVIVEVPDDVAGHAATGRYITFADLLARGCPRHTLGDAAG